jgi:hypothetical protein
MKLVPVALFIGDLLSAPAEAKVRRRYRKKGMSSQVACSVTPRDGALYSVPIFRPDVPRRAHFRLQLRVPLVAGRPDDEFALVIQPQFESRVKDPEQTLLAPIYAGPDRLIFEFTRAEVLWCRSDGTFGLRFAAIDPATGQLGTKDTNVPGERYESALARCRGQLAGDSLLFPPRHDLHRKAARIPHGTPHLMFDPPNAGGVEPCQPQPPTPYGAARSTSGLTTVTPP